MPVKTLRELHAMFPETRQATILHEIFMMQSNFTRWAPGDHATRPGVETPYANLFLAGDWVNTKAPVFLMEAAVFTGRQAANARRDRPGSPASPAAADGVDTGPGGSAATRVPWRVATT